LPLYKVVGRDETIVHSSAALVKSIKKGFPKQKVFYLANPVKIKPFLIKNMKTLVQTDYSPVVIMMGAGDIVGHTERLLK
jgi:hypothetical protein